MPQIRAKQREMLRAVVGGVGCVRISDAPASVRWRVRVRTNGSPVLTFHARTGDLLVAYGLLVPAPQRALRSPTGQFTGEPYIPTADAVAMVARMRRK